MATRLFEFTISELLEKLETLLTGSPHDRRKIPHAECQAIVHYVTGIIKRLNLGRESVQLRDHHDDPEGAEAAIPTDLMNLDPNWAPERWTVDGCATGDSDQVRIWTGTHEQPCALLYLKSYNTRPLPNADRLVACVNAMHGVDDPKAFVGIARRNVGAARDAQSWYLIRDYVLSHDHRGDAESGVVMSDDDIAQLVLGVLSAAAGAKAQP